MKQLYKLIFFCLATVFIMACQNDESEIPGGEILKEVTFSASQTTPDSLFTRATDLAFSPGDEIGIYVVKRSNPNISGTLQDNGNYAHNKRYKIDNNGQLKPYGESDKIYLSGVDTYDFYAYYPYQSYVSNPNAFYFNVLPDQSIVENYTKNDFMLARNLTGQNSATINLQFQRKFALVETYFEKIPGKTVTNATLYNKQNSVLVNIGNNTETPTGATANFTMLKQEENEHYYIFRAIVPVQDIPAKEGLFTFTVNGKPITYKATTATPLAPGKKSTYLVDMQYRVYALTADVKGGTVTGAEKTIFRHGERVDLVATPAADYTFSGFYDSIEEKPIFLSNNPVYSFIANKNMQIYGHFTKKDLITITINCSPSKEILYPYYLNPPQVVSKYGSMTTLYGYILTDSPYLFVGWYENGIYLNRDYEYTFTATQDRTLLAKYCRRAFGLGSGGHYEHIKTPGRFIRTMIDKYSVHPTYLKAGQKIQQISNLYYQDLIPNHSLPVIITQKELIIKLGERIILQTNDFEDFVFTAPDNGTYTFHYSVSCEITLLDGEETAGTLNINRTAWYLD